MVPLVDVSMASLLKAHLPDTTIVFANLETGRKKIAAASSQESTNLPGLAYWRIATDKATELSNRPMALEGIAGTYKTDDAGLENALVVHQRRKPVIVTYELNCWTRTLTELNDIERILSFIDVYNPITIDVSGQIFNFTMEEDSPSYSQTPNDRSDGILEFSLSKTLRVHTFWTTSADYRIIHEMFFSYYEGMVEAGPVPEELLETVKFVGTA